MALESNLSPIETNTDGAIRSEPLLVVAPPAERCPT